MSSISDSSFQDIGKPLGVGIVSTEGEKLLNALRKIQNKLHQKQEKSAQKQIVYSFDNNSGNNDDHKCQTCASGDQYIRPKNTKCNKYTNTSMGCQQNEDNSNQLIETRLKLIESQLQNISIQLMANNWTKHEMNGKQIDYKKKTNEYLNSSPKHMMSDMEEDMRSDDKYEISINAIKDMIKSNDKMSKSKSLNTINSRTTNPSKHFHLHRQDIPFLLGTTSSKSHSVIANRQIQISKLKQHNQLCEHQLPTRKIFSETIRANLLDTEIKELLYDLHEEHNYICEEIQHLTKQLKTITDPKKRVDFNRELYFLSRRILAKKRQINELQELHSIVRKNGPKVSETNVEPKQKAGQQLNKNNVKNKYVNNDSIPKWI